MISGVSSFDPRQKIVTNVQARPRPAVERTEVRDAQPEEIKAPVGDSTALVREYNLLDHAARHLDRIIPSIDQLAVTVE